MQVSPRKVKIFKIRNRKGYGCACLNHLTEGKTPLQAYQRMAKALRRSGSTLKDLDARSVKRLVTNLL